MTLTSTFHRRDEWEDPNWPVDARYSFTYKMVNGLPVAIPGSGHVSHVPNGVPVHWPSITIASIHYTADDDLPDGDPGEFLSDIPKYLRAIQQSYAMFRAYSIGYNFIYDWLGGVWEGRGWDIRCAANATMNDHTIAHLMLVDGADPTTLATEASVREMIAEQDQRTTNDVFILGHGQLPGAQTACPGKGILGRMKLGVYNPGYTPPSTTTGADVAKIYAISDKDENGQSVVTDLAIISVTGTFAEWIATENDLNALVFTGVVDQDQPKGVLPPKPFVMDRGLLKLLKLVGDAPIYPDGYTGIRTSANDFRRP